MERLVCGLSRQFSARGLDVHTVFPKADGSAALIKWCEEQGANVQSNSAVRELNLPHSWQDMLDLRRYVKTFRPHVVNLHYGDNFISLKDVLAIRVAGVKRCVCSVHGASPWNAENEQKRKMTRLASLLCEAVVANSTATHSLLRQAGVAERKIQVIPCGVQAPAHLPTRADARLALGLPSAAFVIATAARLVPGKGIAELIEAVARIPDTQRELALAIAGDGPEKVALQECAKKLLNGRAIFLGHVSDMNNLYAASDVFALPSHMESFGLVFIEAAFHGIPSIGTNVGGIPDAIANGESGLLVPVSDVVAMANAIQRLRIDPGLRHQLGESARRRSNEMFTETAMATRYLESLHL